MYNKYTRLFTADLFVIVKSWKHSKFYQYGIGRIRHSSSMQWNVIKKIAEALYKSIHKDLEYIHKLKKKVRNIVYYTSMFV